MNKEQRVDPDIFFDESSGHELGRLINEEKLRLASTKKPKMAKPIEKRDLYKPR